MKRPLPLSLLGLPGRKAAKWVIATVTMHRQGCGCWAEAQATVRFLASGDNTWSRLRAIWGSPPFLPQTPQLLASESPCQVLSRAGKDSDPPVTSERDTSEDACGPRVGKGPPPRRRNRWQGATGQPSAPGHLAGEARGSAPAPAPPGASSSTAAHCPLCSSLLSQTSPEFSRGCPGRQAHTSYLVTAAVPRRVREPHLPTASSSFPPLQGSRLPPQSGDPPPSPLRGLIFPAKLQVPSDPGTLSRPHVTSCPTCSSSVASLRRRGDSPPACASVLPLTHVSDSACPAVGVGHTLFSQGVPCPCTFGDARRAPGTTAQETFTE